MKILFYFLFTLLILTSCSKKKGCTDVLSIDYDAEAEVDDGACKYGGDGGQVTVVLYPYISGRYLKNSAIYLDSAYVKFNAIKVPPGMSNGGDPNGYDKIYTGVIGDSCVRIVGLKRGKYFIYLTAADSFLINAHKRGTFGFQLILDQASGEKIMHVELGKTCCVF